MADSHVHLDRYSRSEASAMLARARRVGVRRFLAIGVDLATSRAALALTRTRRGVSAAVGVHPTRLAGLDLTSTLVELRELAVQPGVAAIGEVGVDSDPQAGDLRTQERFFAACLALAADCRLALSLHVVGAHGRVLSVAAGHDARRIVVHYFQGDAALADSYLSLGCSISVGKPVTRLDRVELREAVRQTPLDRLLLETDSYPLPGRSTEPADVAEICRAVAELKDVDYDAVATATTANFRRLFEGR